MSGLDNLSLDIDLKKNNFNPRNFLAFSKNKQPLL